MKHYRGGSDTGSRYTVRDIQLLYLSSIRHSLGILTFVDNTDSMFKETTRNWCVLAGLVVTRANIRIWIHDRDLGRLQQMLWEGHGGKLRVETSNNPRVKRFLDAVPYIMVSYKRLKS